MSFLREMWQGLKQNVQTVAGLGSVAVSAAFMYPDVWGVKQAKRVLQMYRDGEPEPVDSESLHLGQQVLDKVLWDISAEAGVDFFTAYGQDIIHQGSTYIKQGAIIGIPVCFKYRSSLDVEKEKITLNNITIDWTSAPGKQLLDSLVLSEKARQFAIARELFYTHTYHMFVKGGFVATSLFLSYGTGFMANRIYGFSRRLPVLWRGILYSMFASMGATLYCFALDNYNWYRDRKVDREAAELGLEYAEGGVEFYNKLLQRNISIRAMLGAEGGKKYTAYGNDIHFWRSPSMPLTSRRDAMQVKVKSLQEKPVPQPEQNVQTS